MSNFRRLLGLGNAHSPPCGNQDPAVNVKCSEFEVNNWVVSDFIVAALLPVVGAHPFPLDELVLMVSAVCRLKPSHLFEWGTHTGKSARIFYETSRYFGLDLEIHSVDLPDDAVHQEHPGEQRGRFVKGLRDVHLHQGDGLNTTLSIYRTLKQPVKALVFIDGDHSYDTVKRELGGIMKNMPEANILLHDTFYQSEESGYNIGPHQAIVQTLSAIPHTYRCLSTRTGLPGMTLLYRL